MTTVFSQVGLSADINVSQAGQAPNIKETAMDITTPSTPTENVAETSIGTSGVQGNASVTVDGKEVRFL